MALLDFLGFGGKSAEDFPAIDCAQALKGAQDKTLIVIDVRTPAEWADTGVPANAKCKMLQAPDFADYVRSCRDAAPNLPIALFCLSGARSLKAAKAARKAGLDNLHIVRGGVDAWRKAGLPLENI